MKKECTIKKLHDDSQLDSLVRMHREIFLNTALQDKLIYFDENFREYFRKVLLYENQYIFGIFFDCEINGFLHFKKYENSLFLNNIFIDEKIRGKGTGTSVLNKILHQPFIGEEGFEFLELDVLESNPNAKRWYDKLGLFEINKDTWYLVNQISINKTINPNFEIAVDDNNFNSVFYNNKKVATIINDSYIIAHDKIALKYTAQKNILYKGRDLVSSKDEYMQYSEIDSSIRMKGKISQITNTLQCLNLK
ncbi:GNAT family N-acetyltransferase [Chryseobacterium sp. SSA4.19]|uniref:GNAT family N-acetyltransferase n=1 Tax=Chryseobacterium sp. SSA4.19 TaxID=2919915 RepID=UPI001F4E4EEE|nr:GNAT family N-acetyltransferase [Chryseobacterium sp. SSA4.19]MCJ8152372.1 GNAT family N-acetyltransferase [Chryseobacterium sp. SSA4.19]